MKALETLCTTRGMLAASLLIGVCCRSVGINEVRVPSDSIFNHGVPWTSSAAALQASKKGEHIQIHIDHKDHVDTAHAVAHQILAKVSNSKQKGPDRRSVLAANYKLFGLNRRQVCWAWSDGTEGAGGQHCARVMLAKARPRTHSTPGLLFGKLQGAEGVPSESFPDRVSVPDAPCSHCLSSIAGVFPKE